MSWHKMLDMDIELSWGLVSEEKRHKLLPVGSPPEWGGMNGLFTELIVAREVKKSQRIRSLRLVQHVTQSTLSGGNN